MEHFEKLKSRLRPSQQMIGPWWVLWIDNELNAKAETHLLSLRRGDDGDEMKLFFQIKGISGLEFAA